MTTDQPFVSIITPVYNGAKYLKKLIESVQMQDYHNIEHIIIDDDSTDDGATVAILRKYPHLRWWSRENKGQYATMNEGLEAARGELVCFISADDMMAPGAVCCVVEFMRLHPDYDGVYGSYFWIDENDAPHRAQNIVHHAPLNFYRYFPFIGHCSLYLKKTILEKRKLYFDASLEYVGDYDWIMRLIKAKLQIGYVAQTLSSVRSHKEQTSNRQSKTMTEEHITVLKRYGVSRIVFRAVNFTIYWLSAAQRMEQALWEMGPQGIMRLIREWRRRRKAKNP